MLQTPDLPHDSQVVRTNSEANLLAGVPIAHSHSAAIRSAQEETHVRDHLDFPKKKSTN